MKNLWWGYMHSETQEILVKRYFDEKDIETARQSDFVMLVFYPVEAETGQEALKTFENKLELAEEYFSQQIKPSRGSRYDVDQ